MKVTPTDVALSLVETCKSLPEERYPEAADAALEMLRRHGLSRALRTFPRMVREVLRKRERMVFGSLTVPNGGEEAATRLLPVLEKALGRKVSLAGWSDPSLLGGALLQVGDDRFDASLRGALSRLKDHLTVV